MESKKLEIGSKVKFKGKDKLLGVIVGIASEPIPKFRDHYVYCVEWDNGALGMPKGNSIEEIKNENNER